MVCNWILYSGLVQQRHTGRQLRMQQQSDTRYGRGVYDCDVEYERERGHDDCFRPGRYEVDEEEEGMIEVGIIGRRGRME